MRILRNALLAVTAAAALTVSPANAAGIVIVEGESATSWTSGCGDGGDAMDMGPANYGVRQTMFFPASGCTATYENTGAVAIAAATFVLSGQAPSICGTITLSGTTVGAVAFCNANDTAVTVNFSPPVVTATGAFTVTWTTGPGTASYCNLFLDYLVGVGV